MFFCHECFQSLELRDIIKSQNIIGDCQVETRHKNVFVCDSEKTSVALQGVKDFLRQVLDLYTVEPLLPDTFPSHRKNLLKNALKDDWSLFFIDSQKIDTMIRHIFNRESEFDLVILDKLVGVKEENDAEHPDLIIKGNDWERFVESITYENRFHLNMINLENLKYFIKYTTTKIEDSSNNIYYRSRISNSEKLEITNLYGPPKGQAVSGRLNSQWISALYLSDDKEATLQEVRASFHDTVYIGEFKIKKQNLTLANLSAFHNTSLNGEVDILKYYLNRNVLKSINDELTKPTNRDNQSISYIPLQYISDLIKSYYPKFDGIIYNSVMKGKAKNIMMFDENIVECIRVQEVKITDVNYNYN